MNQTTDCDADGQRHRKFLLGNAPAPRQLLLRGSTSCIHAAVLASLTYIIHMDVVNAGIAGVNICLSRQRKVLK